MSFPNKKDLMNSQPTVEMHNAFIPPEQSTSGFKLVPQSTRLEPTQLQQKQQEPIRLEPPVILSEQQISNSSDKIIQPPLPISNNNLLNMENINNAINKRIETELPETNTDLPIDLSNDIPNDLTDDIDSKIKTISFTKLLRIQALYDDYKEIINSQEYVDLDNDIKRLSEKIKKKKAKKRKLDSEANKIFKMISERMIRYEITEIDLSNSNKLIKHENPLDPKATFGKTNLKKAMTTYFNDDSKADQMMSVFENLIINEKKKNLKPKLVIKDVE